MKKNIIRYEEEGLYYEEYKQITLSMKALTEQEISFGNEMSRDVLYINTVILLKQMNVSFCSTLSNEVTISQIVIADN